MWGDNAYSFLVPHMFATEFTGRSLFIAEVGKICGFEAHFGLRMDCSVERLVQTIRGPHAGHLAYKKLFLKRLASVRVLEGSRENAENILAAMLSEIEWTWSPERAARLLLL